MSPYSAISDSSFLAVNPPPSPTSRSLDGETLRSRSDSFRSDDLINRTRSNSTRTAVGRSSFEEESSEEALRPDKGNEQDFQVAENPFAFTPGHLNKLLNPKSLSAFKALGGLRGLEKGLRTSTTAGLSVDENDLDGSISFNEATDTAKDKGFNEVPIKRQESQSGDGLPNAQFRDRIRIFKDNRLPERKADNIWVLIWRTYNDKILILLTIAAVVSLALGLYETFSGGSSVDWMEGVAICVAILIVVVVGATNDFQKEKQFIKLNKRVS